MSDGKSVFETYSNDNRTAPNGDPAGGTFHVVAKDGGVLMSGTWQNGPVAENGENGVGVENLLNIVADRLRFYQKSRFACPENADALADVEHALSRLNDRTARRTAAGVEGRSVRMAGEGRDG